MRITHVLLAAAFYACLAFDSLAAEREVLLATTTSVQDSGLLDVLLPQLTKETGVAVRVIAVGSGAALRMGADGNADVVLSHAPAAELELMKTNVFAARTPFMENHFLIAGPAEDPAGAREASDGADAFRRIATATAALASRGDDSGTHKREQELLLAAGLGARPEWPGVVRTGAGMAATLLVAGEKRAYVLSDLATFLAFQKRTGLARLTRTPDDLRNVYSLLPVRPEAFPGRIHAEDASIFVEWMLRAKTARAIAEFGRTTHGEPLFRPLEPAR
ncbi:MAG: tungsten ABC transporter substrate-binding protein [Deltaproteobacteria bacterium]|nr:tungsten ABC transporter substrate-binding protein [Deltaproteobacteria bacterium]